MLIKKPTLIKSSEITSESNYINRRNFIKSSTLIGGSILSNNLIGANLPDAPFAELQNIQPSNYSTD